MAENVARPPHWLRNGVKFFFDSGWSRFVVFTRNSSGHNVHRGFSDARITRALAIEERNRYDVCMRMMDDSQDNFSGFPRAAGMGAWFRVLLTATMFGGISVFAAAPPTVEEAQKQIAEKFSDVRSCTALVTTIETSDPGDGTSARAEIRRRIEWKRAGGSFLYRAESSTEIRRTSGGITTTEEATATSVSDGVHVVAITEQEGRTSATKRKADISNVPDTSALLDELRVDQTLRRLPDTKVGTSDCFVIQVIPKNRADSDITQTVIYVRKDIGMDVRTIVYDKKNKPIYTSTTTDIRINPELSADRFRVALPDGVELVDQSGGS